MPVAPHIPADYYPVVFAAGRMLTLVSPHTAIFAAHSGLGFPYTKLCSCLSVRPITIVPVRHDYLVGHFSVSSTGQDYPSLTLAELAWCSFHDELAYAAKLGCLSLHPRAAGFSRPPA